MWKTRNTVIEVSSSDLVNLYSKAFKGEKTPPLAKLANRLLLTTRAEYDNALKSTRHGNRIVKMGKKESDAIRYFQVPRIEEISQKKLTIGVHGIGSCGHSMKTRYAANRNTLAPDSDKWLITRNPSDTTEHQKRQIVAMVAAAVDQGYTDIRLDGYSYGAGLCLTVYHELMSNPKTRDYLEDKGVTMHFTARNGYESEEETLLSKLPSRLSGLTTFARAVFSGLKMVKPLGPKKLDEYRKGYKIPKNSKNYVVNTRIRANDGKLLDDPVIGVLNEKGGEDYGCTVIDVEIPEDSCGIDLENPDLMQMHMRGLAPDAMEKAQNQMKDDLTSDDEDDWNYDEIQQEESEPEPKQINDNTIDALILEAQQISKTNGRPNEDDWSWDDIPQEESDETDELILEAKEEKQKNDTEIANTLHMSVEEFQQEEEKFSETLKLTEKDYLKAFEDWVKEAGSKKTVKSEKDLIEKVLWNKEGGRTSRTEKRELPKGNKYLQAFEKELGDTYGNTKKKKGEQELMETFMEENYEGGRRKKRNFFSKLKCVLKGENKREKLIDKLRGKQNKKLPRAN